MANQVPAITTSDDEFLELVLDPDQVPPEKIALLIEALSCIYGSELEIESIKSFPPERRDSSDKEDGTPKGSRGREKWRRLLSVLERGVDFVWKEDARVKPFKNVVGLLLRAGRALVSIPIAKHKLLSTRSG